MFRFRNTFLRTQRAFIIGVCWCGLLSSTTPLFAVWQKISSSQPQLLSGGAYFQEIEAQSDGTRVRAYAVIFNEKKCRLRVLDNPAGETKSLEDVLRPGRYFAGVNGGYFHENFEPVGLMVSDQKVLHPSEKARLLSGVLEIRKGSIRLLRSKEFRPSKSVLDALQAGPFLIENGKGIYGLNEIRAARRTVIASDGSGNWALISMTPITLAQASRLLLTPHLFFKWRSWHALNLDGGSSTAFGAATKPHPFLIHEFAVVRNFLVLEP